MIAKTRLYPSPSHRYNHCDRSQNCMMDARHAIAAHTAVPSMARLISQAIAGAIELPDAFRVVGNRWVAEIALVRRVVR